MLGTCATTTTGQYSVLCVVKLCVIAAAYTAAPVVLEHALLAIDGESSDVVSGRRSSFDVPCSLASPYWQGFFVEVVLPFARPGSPSTRCEREHYIIRGRGGGD